MLSKYIQMPDVILFTIIMSVLSVTGYSAYTNELRKDRDEAIDVLLAKQIHRPEYIDSQKAVVIATDKVMEKLNDRSVHLPKGKEKLSVKQMYLLTFAYFTARLDKVKPEILQGIIWQESKAGEYPGYRVAGHEYGLGPMQRYYGVAQIKLSAARDVLKAYPNEFRKFDTDEELIANLILNDQFNVKIASKYLRIIGKSSLTTSKNYKIAAYNRGVAGAKSVDVDTFHYTVAVNKHIKQIMNIFNYEIHAFTRTNNQPRST